MGELPWQCSAEDIAWFPLIVMQNTALILVG